MPGFTSRTLVALAFTLIVWASAFAGIRAGLHASSPANLAILRFLIASLVLAIYAGIAHFRRPELRDVPGLILTGALGITFYNLALNYGETRVTAGAASLLIASTPIGTALAARFWLHEKLTAIGWCGVFVSFAGVALIASGEGEGIRLSPQALIILSAAVTSALYMILQKHYLGRSSALEFTAYSIWFGTALMLPFGHGLMHTLRAAPASATVAVIYLGIFPGALAYVGVGLRVFAWRRRTHGYSALCDSDCGHWHCMDLAGRGAEADLFGRGRSCARRRGSGEYRGKKARREIGCGRDAGLGRSELTSVPSTGPSSGLVRRRRNCTECAVITIT